MDVMRQGEGSGVEKEVMENMRHQLQLLSQVTIFPAMVVFYQDQVMHQVSYSVHGHFQGFLKDGPQRKEGYQSDGACQREGGMLEREDYRREGFFQWGCIKEGDFLQGVLD